MKKKSVPFLVHFVGGKTVKYSKLRFRFTVRAGECQRVIEHSVIKENKNTKSKWNFFSACIKSCYQLTFSQRVGSLQLLIFFGIFFSIVFVFRSKIFNRYKQQKQKKHLCTFGDRIK